MNFNNTLFLKLNTLTGYSVFSDTSIVFLAQFLIFAMAVMLFVYMMVSERTSLFSQQQNSSKYRFYEIVIFIGFVSCVMLVVTWIKWYFAIPRPFLQFPEVVKLFSYGGFDSFPSGHAALSAALATVGYIYNKRFGVILYICALLVGISRVVAGVHFPFDIVVGYMLGIGITGGLFLLYKKLFL